MFQFLNRIFSISFFVGFLIVGSLNAVNYNSSKLKKKKCRASNKVLCNVCLLPFARNFIGRHEKTCKLMPKKKKRRIKRKKEETGCLMSGVKGDRRRRFDSGIKDYSRDIYHDLSVTSFNLFTKQEVMNVIKIIGIPRLLEIGRDPRMFTKIRGT